MLETVNNIVWSETSGCYGPLPEMPTYLRKLASADPVVSKDALKWVSNQIEHQGTLFPATSITIPFLFEILADAHAHHRSDIIWLLLGLAVDEVVPLLPNGFDPEKKFGEVKSMTYDLREVLRILKTDDWGPLDDRLPLRWQYEAYCAVEQGTEVLMPLTADDDPTVRVATLRALGRFPATAKHSISFVRTAALQEDEDFVLGNAILTLGLLARYVGDTNDVPWLVTKMSGEQPLLVRRCAALALGTLVGAEELPTEALNILIDATEDKSGVVKHSQQLLWRGCSFMGYFWRVLHSLGV